MAAKQNELDNHRQRAEDSLVINARMLVDLQAKEKELVHAKEKDVIIESLANANTKLEKQNKELRSHFSNATRFEEYLAYSAEGEEGLPGDVRDIVDVARGLPDQFCLLTARVLTKRMTAGCKAKFLKLMVEDCNKDELGAVKEAVTIKGNIICY